MIFKKKEKVFKLSEQREWFLLIWKSHFFLSKERPNFLHFLNFLLIDRTPFFINLGKMNETGFMYGRFKAPFSGYFWLKSVKIQLRKLPLSCFQCTRIRNSTHFSHYIQLWTDSIVKKISFYASTSKRAKKTGVYAARYLVKVTKGGKTCTFKRNVVYMSFSLSCANAWIAAIFHVLLRLKGTYSILFVSDLLWISADYKKEFIG